MQAFADERIRRVVFLDFGMDEVIVMVELTGFAEEHVFLVGLEAVFDPFQSAEEHNLDRSGFIGKSGGSSLSAWCSDELYLADGADELVVHQVVVHLCHFVDLALVDIPERELVEHVHEGEHLEFFAQDSCLLRPDAFQVADVCMQQVDFHLRKDNKNLSPFNFHLSPFARLLFTKITPVNTSTAASTFCQVNLSIPKTIAVTIPIKG